MAYFKPNLGKRYTQSRSIVCLLSNTVDTGVYTPPMTVQFREVGYDWSSPETFTPYKMLELSEEPGDKTIECRFTDSLAASFTISQVVTLLEDADRRFPWNPITQEIANNLPNWHPGRRLRSSNWQTFMNLPATAAWSIARSFTKLTDAMFLQSSPISEMDQVGRIFPDSQKLETGKRDTNLLINPAFGLGPSPFGHPNNWGVSSIGTNWDLTTTDKLFGQFGLSVNIDAGDSGTLIQEISDITLGVGESVRASVYYKTDLAPVPTAVPATVDFHARLIGLYEDGTTVSNVVTLDPETDGSWFTAAPAITATKILTRLFLVVHLDEIPALSPMDIFVAGAVVSLGTKERDFEFGHTWPHHFNSQADVDIEPSQELWLTTSYDEFWERAIPTRVSTPTSTATAGPFTAITTASPAFQIQDALRQTFNIGYLAVGGKIRMYETASQSNIADYNLAMPTEDGFAEEEDLVVEAVTYFSDRLWAVVSFADEAALDRYRTIYNYGAIGPDFDGGNKLRYITVVEHRTPAEQTSYMEIVQMYPLIELATANPVVKLQFVEDDPQWVYFWTASTEYYSRLYYDYGLVRDDGSVLIREPETKVSLT